MCGIAGCAGGPAEGRHEAVALMLEALRHRGPDSQGSVVGDGWCLGARRLAIIDLETGDQPVSSEGGTVTAVLNGEIYNFEELRRGLLARGHRLRSSGDTEVIPHLWEELGQELVTRLRGMFALAVADRSSGVILLARDRVGKKPLYWTVQDGRLYFASELKALRAAVPTLGGVDRDALRGFLTFGFVPEGECIVPGVRRLPPGSLMLFRISDGSVVERPYASWRWDVDDAVNGEAARAILESELAEAVSLRLRADVPLAIFLSGGIDSGLVAALACRTGPAPRALTVSFGARHDELSLASATASRIGARLEEVRVEPEDGLKLLPRLPEIFDEPLADASVIPTVLVARAARERAKVVLNGDGGDEVLGGYRRVLAASMASAPLARYWLPVAARTAGVAAGRRVWADRLIQGFQGHGHPYLAWGPTKFDGDDVGRLMGGDVGVPRSFAALVARFEGLPLAQAVRAMDFELFLPGDLLVKMDRATMAASLEARSPFLDQVLIERLSRVSPRVLLRWGRGKAIVRRFAASLLPREVVRAPKRGFEAPLVEWLAGPWREQVRVVTEDPAARVRAILDSRALATWTRWASHRDAERAARALFTLVTLEHWLQRWGT